MFNYLYLLFFLWTAVANSAFTSDFLDNLPYDINLMWINKSLESGQNNEYVFPTTTTESRELKKPIDVVLQINTWAYLNKNARVYVWYDSKFTTSQQIKKTRALLGHNNKILKNGGRKQDIVLADLREYLPILNEHPEIFDNPNTFVYLKADLLRLWISFKQASESTNPKYISIYADLDVTPLNKEELFDAETEDLLAAYGFIFKKPDIGKSYENSFHMVSCDKDTLKALNEGVLKPFIANYNSDGKLVPEFIYNISTKIFHFYNLLLRGVILKLERINDDDNSIITTLSSEEDNTELFTFRPNRYWTSALIEARFRAWGRYEGDDEQSIIPFEQVVARMPIKSNIYAPSIKVFYN